jgi:hypothetical protein
MLQSKSIKKYMTIAGLLLVALKMTYNIYAFAYDTHNLALEEFFKYGMILILLYFCIYFTKKPKKNIG